MIYVALCVCASNAASLYIDRSVTKGGREGGKERALELYTKYVLVLPPLEEKNKSKKTRETKMKQNKERKRDSTDRHDLSLTHTHTHTTIASLSSFYFPCITCLLYSFT